MDWIHPMHGGSFQRAALPNYAAALAENEFAFRGLLLGREMRRSRRCNRTSTASW
jgi:hypothetical protein